MTALLLLAGAVFLAMTAPVSAHRLDEFLQASTIELTQDRIALQLRLTPGISVAEQDRRD